MLRLSAEDIFVFSIQTLRTFLLRGNYLEVVKVERKQIKTNKTCLSQILTNYWKPVFALDT